MKKKNNFFRKYLLGLIFILIPSLVWGEIIPSDRKVNWNPGIPGGIPARTTIFTNVVTGYGAKGDGVTDDTGAIKNAIAACPEGQVVYLPAGTYRVTGEISISKGIVLRGAGPDKTKIRNNGTATNIIFVGVYQGTPIITSVVSGSSKGSTSITVGNASSFNVGEYIILDQINNPSLVSVGDCTWFTRDRNSRAIGQILKITGKSGNTLSINPELYFNYESRFSPEIVKLANSRVEYAGIEDMAIERVNRSGATNVKFVNTAYCWLKNIETINCNVRHVQFTSAYRCVVRDSYFHHATSYAGGGNGYGMTLTGHASNCLIENNIFYFLRHSIVLESAGAGNVISYNYSERLYDDSYPNTSWIMADLSTHCAHQFMNLFEGNYANHIGADYTHGSSSHNTFFRNYIDGDNYGLSTQHRIAVDISTFNYYFNLVGNVLGRPGVSGEYELENGNCTGSTIAAYKLGYSSDGDCSATGNDPNVKTSLIRHGNYDYMSGSTKWDPMISDKALPASYYLTQKPAFFGCRQWPPFGPDVSPMIGSLPAKDRFEGKNPCNEGGDTIPPYAEGYNPAKGASGVAADTALSVHIKDSGNGVDQSKIVMNVMGTKVAPTISGAPADYTLSYKPSSKFGNNQAVSVTLAASDLAGNAMPLDNWTFTTAAASDTIPPVITIISPTTADTYISNTRKINLSGTASDNVGVASVSWSNDRGGMGTASGTTNWSINNIVLYEGENRIQVTAYDTSGISSADVIRVSYSIKSGTYIEEFGDASSTFYPGTCLDTYINFNSYSTINYAFDQYLNTYTTASNTPANRIIMKWDLNPIPASAEIKSAVLSLDMGALYGTGGDIGYEITAHKIINKNPMITTCNWNTYDGTNAWSGGANGAAQDMALAESSQVIDKTLYKYSTWDVTKMVREWISNPQSNYGMILNSDTSAVANSNRRFCSTQYSNAASRPKLIITYVIGSTNTPPEITPAIPNISTSEDVPITLDLAGYKKDTQDSGNALTWSVSGANAALLKVSFAGSDTLSINPLPDANGSDVITITLTDSGGMTDTQDITVAIAAVNDPPVISPAVPNITSNEDIPATLDLSPYKTDVDDSIASLVWSVSGVNATLFGASIDKAANVLTITPQPNANGSATIKLILTDPAGRTDSQDVIVKFNPVNDPPIIGAIPDISVSGSPVTVNLGSYGTDMEDSPAALVWSVSGVNTALFSASINNTTKSLTITPVANAKGSDTITLSLTDAGNLNDTQDVIVNIGSTSNETITEEFGSATNSNHPGTCQDTYVNFKSYALVNYSSDPYLNTYTTPMNNSANRIIMKWDLSSIPANAVIKSAVLSLNMTAMYGTGGDVAYEVSAHKIINKNLVVSACNWNTYDGRNAWTGGANGGAQDMSPAESLQVIDKTIGKYNSWDIPKMAADWVADPSKNFGMILNSDITASNNSNRRFSSTQSANASQRPKLIISYSVPANDTTNKIVKEFGSAAGTNYPGTCLDTYINHSRYSAINYASDPYLNTYTTPANNAANRIVMKWDLSAIPSNAVIQSAVLSLNMGAMYGTGGDSGYEVSAHKVINRNPAISSCNWNSYNGTAAWTGGANGGLQDMAPPEDTQIVDKTVGKYSNWTITKMVAEWVANPSGNFGLIMNSDVTAASESNRRFFSSQYSNPNQRPKLIVTYTTSGGSAAKSEAIETAAAPLSAPASESPTASGNAADQTLTINIKGDRGNQIAAEASNDESGEVYEGARIQVEGSQVISDTAVSSSFPSYTAADKKSAGNVEVEVALGIDVVKNDGDEIVGWLLAKEEGSTPSLSDPRWLDMNPAGYKLTASGKGSETVNLWLKDLSDNIIVVPINEAIILKPQIPEGEDKSPKTASPEKFDGAKIQVENSEAEEEISSSFPSYLPGNTREAGDIEVNITLGIDVVRDSGQEISGWILSGSDSAAVPSAADSRWMEIDQTGYKLTASKTGSKTVNLWLKDSSGKIIVVPINETMILKRESVEDAQAGAPQK